MRLLCLYRTFGATLSKKAPRFVQEFIGDYIGNTMDDFAKNLSLNMERAKEFLMMCDADLDYARDQLKFSDTQETRRVWIRAIPPWVEGKLSFLRVMPYLYPPLLHRIPNNVQVLFAETMLPIRNRSSAKDTIKNTLLGIGEVAKMNVPPDLMGEAGAQALMYTFEIRDSLMHPRSIEGYLVSDEAVRSANVGVDWFNHKFVGVFTPLIEVVKEMSSKASGDA
jgi:hypothetical protein